MKKKSHIPQNNTISKKLSEARKIGIPAMEMKPEIEKVLSALQASYVQAGKLDRVDVDQDHHHDNELTSIAERKGMMVLFRFDRD